MSDENPLDGEQKQVVQPEDVIQEELTERQKQQLDGWQKLASGQRNVIRESLKEPTQANVVALKQLQETEPKFAKALLKEYWYEDIDGYAKAVKVQSTPLAPQKEEVFKYLEEFEQQRTVASTKAQIDSQFASLPEWIREQAQKEFQDLTDGRTLTPSQLTDFAKKAVTLANASTGTSYRLNLSNLSSTSLSSTLPPAQTDTFASDLAEAAKHDPFAAAILRGRK